MLTFIQSIKDTHTRFCSAERWEEMVDSSQTAEYIKQFRKTCNIDWKQRLPAVNFHGYDPAALNGCYGSRKQDKLQPTGLFMLDVDHIDDPKDLWLKFLQVIKEQKLWLNEVVALVHVTPSGKGLRIVMKGREGSCIKDDQAWLAQLLGVQHDECTKDLSRWSFVPTKSDILYINKEILFAPVNDSTNYNSKTTENNERTIFNGARNLDKRGDGPSEQGSCSNAETRDLFGSQDMDAMDETDSPSSNFPSTFRGIPYETIVERLIQAHGGRPEVGERHARIIKLANDLKTITDRNVDWMMELIPTFDKSRIEKKNAIIWAVNHESADQTPKLKTVLAQLQEELSEKTNDEEPPLEGEVGGGSKMPPMPEKLPKLVELLTSNVMDFQKPAVAQMCFPALAAHVADSLFINNEKKTFELALMGVLVGKQSVGKGCIDAPIEAIIDSILLDDELAREELRAWAESQQNKKANEKGSQRPEKPIRILNTDTTPAALLANLFNAERNGYAKNLCCFTKSEEIEEMYDMSPTSGRSKVAQLIKKTYDRGRIGSERFTSAAANYTTILRWNWVSACTPDKAKMFFKKVLVDGTLSRIDFAAILAPEDDIDFVYGDYDEAFEEKLEPYIEKLKAFRCERNKKGRLIPFRLEKLSELEKQMDAYIKSYAKEMPDDTWKNYAWRTKLNALKKILILYIANGSVWEEEFEDFLWWTFHYGMWVKMNLFYEKAREAFGEENLLASVSIGSPLELVGDEFTREQFYAACQSGGFTSPRQLIYKYTNQNKIKKNEKGMYCKTSA